MRPWTRLQDYGVLIAEMFYADDTPIPFDRFHAPRIEDELAFVLKAPLRQPTGWIEVPRR